MSLSDLTNLDSRKWEDLYFLRKKYAGNPDLQSILAPYEHRAYYREMAQTDPYQAMAMSLIEPVYQGVKPFLSSDNMTTPPSLDQITQSWKGIYEGLRR